MSKAQKLSEQRIYFQLKGHTQLNADKAAESLIWVQNLGRQLRCWHFFMGDDTNSCEKWAGILEQELEKEQS